MSDLIHPELSYKLNGIFYEVQNNLGKELKEKQYADAIELIFKRDDIKYRREIEIPIVFSGGKIAGNKLDFIVENQIAVDVKTKKYITKDNYRQMQRYLKATNLKLGIIVNFRGDSVTVKRIINSKGKEEMNSH